MSAIRRLWNVVRRSRLDDDLRQELETHLALIEEEERARGSSAEQARQKAQSRFGHPLAHRERALDAVIATWFESAVKDATFAARRLVRSPTFTMATVLTLALAIGANASVFAVVQRVVLNPLPYPDSDRLIVLDHAAGVEGLVRPGPAPWMTPGLYYHYTDRARTLDGLAIYRTQEQTVTGNGEPERIRIARATTTLASVMRVWPSQGRWFTDAEGAPGAPPVAVLSHGFWMRRYGGVEGIPGRSITLGGTSTAIVGVMPASYAFPDSRVDVWIPDPLSRATGFGVFSHSGVARLRNGATISGARAELTGLIADLPQAYPGVPLASTLAHGFKLLSTAITLKDAMVGHVARALWILLASVGLVLLVACANVASLFLVRSEVRQREVAIRQALGAGRRGIARFFVAESALLSIAGGAIGLTIASGATRVLVAFGPASLPRLEEVRLDGAAVIFTFVITAFAALASGSIPLWRLAHGTPLAVSLHESGRGNTASRGRHRTRHLLMGGQVALALVLLISSGLMVRSFQKLRALDPGFNATSALTFRIGLPVRDYPSRAAAVAAHEAIIDRLSSLAGVAAVSASTCLPLADEGYCFGTPLQVRGRDTREDSVPPPAAIRAVAGGYHSAMGIRLLSGRGLERADVDRSEPIAVVNHALVNAYFPNQDPIGARLAPALALVGDQKNPEDPRWLTIVGVVSDTPVMALGETNPLPMMYIPMSVAGGPDMSPVAGPNVAVMSYVVRSATSPPVPQTLLPSVRSAIDTIDANLALAQVRTLQHSLDRSSARMAFTMVLLAIAAASALLLGVIGIYGSTSYIVSLRTGEIGVRLALGAEPASVARMIVRQGGLVAAAGITVGLATAFAGGRLIESLLYDVSPRDPGVFAATTIAVLGVAFLACWLPARRAARLSPLEALRAD